MTTPFVRTLLVLIALRAGLFASSTTAEPAHHSESSLAEVNCTGLWNIAADNTRAKKPILADLHWKVLEQLEKKECLKEESKRKAAQAVIKSAELLVQGEISHQKPRDVVLFHLSVFCSAQISAKLYDDVPAKFKAFLAEIDAGNRAKQFRTQQAWFEYVEMVVAASFATTEIEQGLAIARGELQEEDSAPIALQARFAIKIGDLLLSRVRIKDALRFYALGLQLDENGERAQHALYWQTLDLYRRGELTAAQDTFKKFENAVSEPSLKNRIPVLKDIIQAKKGSPVDAGIKDPEYMQVWRDINLVGRQ